MPQRGAARLLPLGPPRLSISFMFHFDIVYHNNNLRYQFDTLWAFICAVSSGHGIWRAVRTRCRGGWHGYCTTGLAYYSSWQ